MNDAKALGRKSLIAENGATEAPSTDEGHPPLPVEAEDAPQFVEEFLDVVTAALLAKPAEVSEIFANLGVRNRDSFSQLLGADDESALRLQRGEGAGVQRQAVNYN